MTVVTGQESPAHLFDRDTAVVVGGDGIFAADLSERWDRLGGGPLGGYPLAVAVRALAATTPFPDPLVVSAQFLRPAQHGAAKIATEQVRLGRSVATVEGRFLQGDVERLRVLATFTDLALANGPTTVLGRPPSLPDPDDCIDPFDGLRPTSTVADRLEYRFAEVPGWLRGAPSGNPTVECWLRFTEPRDVDLFSLPLVVDAVAPAVMELGAAGSSTIELTLHVRAQPAPGWLACRATTRYLVGGYHDEDFEVWDSTGRLVAQARQLALWFGGTT